MRWSRGVPLLGFAAGAQRRALRLTRMRIAARRRRIARRAYCREFRSGALRFDFRLARGRLGGEQGVERELAAAFGAAGALEAREVVAAGRAGERTGPLF